MRQTLFRIPLDADWSLGFLGRVPGFGIGLVLILWIVLAGVWLYRNRKELNAGTLLTPVIFWAVVAFAIINIPQWVQRGPRAAIASQSVIIDQQTGSPELALHYLARGRAYHDIYDYENAAKDFQSAIDLAPNNDAGYLGLAWLRATCPDSDFRDGEDALKKVKIAEAVGQPVNAFHLDVLAATYAELGNFEQAVKYAQAAAISADRSMDPAMRNRLAEIRDRLEMYENEQPYVGPHFSHNFPQSVPIRGYGFLMFLGFIAAGFTATRLAKQVGISGDVMWDLGIWALFGGIAGSRLFYLVQYRDRVFANKTLLEKLRAPFELQEGGLVLLGGLLLGSCVFIGYCFYRKLKPLLLADIALPAFFVALAFGRIGCLMNGCCYGDRCELPWAIQFPLGSVPDMALVIRGFVSPESLTSMPLHPSQIYSSINALVLAFLLGTYFRYRHRDGAVLAMGMLIYPITRICIEYLRGDEMGQFGTGFTISQLVSMAIFCAGLLLTFWLNRRSQPATRTIVEPQNVEA